MLLDLHAFWLPFRVAAQATRHALPGLRAGQAFLHVFDSWTISRLQSRGHRAATVVALTSRVAAIASAIRKFLLVDQSAGPSIRSALPRRGRDCLVK